MTDQATRNAQLINELVRISPASDAARFNELCLNFDFEESDVVFFFEPRSGDRLFNIDMEPIPLIILDNQGRTTYMWNDCWIHEGTSTDILTSINLYRKVI